MSKGIAEQWIIRVESQSHAGWIVCRRGTETRPGTFEFTHIAVWGSGDKGPKEFADLPVVPESTVRPVFER